MTEWREQKLSDFMHFNPPTPLPNSSIAKKVAMEQLLPFNKKVQGYEKATFKGGTKFKNGDTLMARITPCLENGKTAYVDFLADEEVAFGSTEFIVLRAKEGVSDSRFIFYLAISDEFRDMAIQLMSGTSGRQRVETEALKEKVFLLPPLPEQKAIAEVLSSLDDKIGLLTRQNKTLEDLAQAYFKKWFIEENENESIVVSDIATLENNSVNPAHKPLELFHHYSIPAFDNAQIPVLELGKAILSNKFAVLPNTILVSKLNPAKHEFGA
jgi:type I restriction enzyme S subunit